MSRRTWVRLAAAALLVLALWYVGRSIWLNLAHLGQQASGPTATFWVGGAIVLALMLLYPVLWLIILRGTGVAMPLQRAYAIWWTTNLGKYVPGKAWMVVGRVYMARQYGKALVLESFAWEFAINCSSSVLAGLLLFWGPGGHRWLWPFVAAAALLSLAPVVHPRLVQRILRSPLRWFGRGTWEAGVHMRRRPYLAALAMATGGWLAWGAAHLLMLRGIGLDAPYWTVTGAYSLAWLLGYVAVAMPAGLGVREGALQLLLAPFTVAGGAALLAVVSRTTILVAEAAAGILGLWMWRADPALTTPRPSAPEASADGDGTPGTRPGGPG